MKIGDFSRAFQVNSDTEIATNQQGTTGFSAFDSDVLERFDAMVSFADTLAQPQPLPGPLVPPPEFGTPAATTDTEATDGGLGQTLEETAEKKVVDAYEKYTSKDFGPDPTRTSSTQTFGDAKMPDNLSSLGGKGGTTIGSLEGNWSALKFGEIDEKAEGDWGSAYAKGYSQLLGVSGQVYYNVGVDDYSIKAGIGGKGSIELIGHHYEVGYSTPGVDLAGHNVDLNTKVGADAYIGIKGSAGAEISLGKNTQLQIGASGFEGASASLQGNVGVGEFVDGSGNITAWAGVGAKAEFDASFKDGKLKVDWGVGLALGLGLEWDLGFTVDFSEFTDFFLDGLREIGLGDVSDWIENTAGDGVQFIGDAANWVGGAAEDAAEAVGDAAEDTWETIEDTAEDVADAAVSTGEAVVDAIGDVFSW